MAAGVTKVCLYSAEKMEVGNSSFLRHRKFEQFSQQLVGWLH